MKIFFTILILLLGYLSLCMVWNKGELIKPLDYKKDCFEVKLVYYLTSDSGKNYYKIKFTNNGWFTEETLLDLEDYTEEWVHLYVNKSFTKTEADALCEKLTCYEDFVSQNKTVKAKKAELEKIYRERGILTYEEFQAKKEKPKPKEPEVKEIIIKSCK